MKVIGIFLIGFGLVVSTPQFFDPQYTASFPIQFYFEVAESQPNRNLIVSPASVTTCLALAYLGAGGKTAKQFHDTLQFNGSSQIEIAQYFGGLVSNFNNKRTDSLEFSIANRVFVDQKYEISSTYNELSSTYLESTVDIVNFTKSVEAAKKINNWVEKQTHNKIKDIVQSTSFDELTIAVLVNAIYFKAPWDNQFSEYFTKKQDFFLTKTEKVQVDMMNIVNMFDVADWDDIGATAIRIPYAGTDIYMLIVLPNTIDGLADMETKLKVTNHRYMQTTPTSQYINLKIPKFKIEFEISLTEILQKMGLTSMFSDGADFSALLKTPQPLKVSDVSHKAFISIDEEGTEAAAATAITTVGASASLIPPEPRNITVDHPFMFVVRDRGNVYFAGRVVNF